jgi:hypothetical protein
VSQTQASRTSRVQDADTILVLGARDIAVQLEEGLPWSRDDSQATSGVEDPYRTGRSHGVDESMPDHPEYVHLQYRQVIVRQNESWEI